MLSSNVALGVRLGKTKSCERDGQAAREDTDVKLVKMSSNAAEVGDLRKRQAAFDVSVQELIA